MLQKRFSDGMLKISSSFTTTNPYPFLCFSVVYLPASCHVLKYNLVLIVTKGMSQMEDETVLCSQ